VARSWQNVDDHPDLIFHGGPIVSFGGGVSGRTVPVVRAQALALTGGRIASVGADRDVLPLAGPATRLVNLRGRAVLPGFQDAHAHPLSEGIRLGWLDLTPTPDQGAALRAISTASAAAGADPDRWVEAVYHPAAWPDGRDPTRSELDAVSPDVPVLLHHGSGHAVVANSFALAIARVTAAASDPAGAVIERDEHGEPTGMLRGSDPAAAFAPVLPALTPEDLRAALRRVSARLAADGVTAVSDADLGAAGSPIDELAAYVGAALDGAFPVRLTVMPGLARLAAAGEAPPGPEDIRALIPPDAGGRVRVGAAKFYADGALSTGDAWLSEPYADARSRPGTPPLGRPAHEPAELAERLLRAHLAGWQLATHAIGDAAVAATLAAYRAALHSAPRPDHRLRIEHAMLLDATLVADLVRLGVVAVIQPEFVATTGDLYRERLGPDRAARIYAYREWLDAGLAIAFGSDRPITRGRPLDGVRAVFRHAGPSGIHLADGTAPTVVEALSAWTGAAAWAARDEDHGGRIEAGLAADVVVLSADPAAVPPEAWADGSDGIRVVATLVGGTAVFGRDALA
jgi:hypothetical protein